MHSIYNEIIVANVECICVCRKVLLPFIWAVNQYDPVICNVLYQTTLVSVVQGQLPLKLVSADHSMDETNIHICLYNNLCLR
jgi:hypothetical protein